MLSPNFLYLVLEIKIEPQVLLLCVPARDLMFLHAIRQFTRGLRVFVRDIGRFLELPGVRLATFVVAWLPSTWISENS